MQRMLNASLIVFFLLLSSLPAPAYFNYAKPNIIGPAGLEVNAYTGNLYYQRGDLFLPGKGMALDLRFHYNSAKTALDLGFGPGWMFSYGMCYQLQGQDIIVRMANGQKILYTFTGAGYTPPTGVCNSLLQYQAGKFVLTTKFGIKYYFDNNIHQKLTRIIDRNGNVITLSYVNNLLSTISGTGGRLLQFSWSSGHLTQISDNNCAAPRTIIFSYDAAWNPIQVSDVMGNPIYYAYNALHELIQVTDKRGTIFVVDWNAYHSVAGISSAAASSSISYNAGGNTTSLSESVNGLVQTTTYTFDANGNIIAISYPSGSLFQYQYDANFNTKAFIDARGNQWTYTHDGKGNLLTETDPYSKTVTYTYDPNFSLKTSMLDKNGNLTTYNYDANGNLLSVTKPMGVSESYTYDAFGAVLTYTDPRGFVTTYTRNSFGYLTHIAYPAGSESYTYDNCGNVLSFTNRMGKTSTYTYNAANLEVSINDPLGNTFLYTYDQNGNVLSQTDWNGNLTQYTYNILGYQTAVITPIGSRTFVYDELGNKLSETDPRGNTWTFVFNAHNRLVSETTPLNHSRSYVYDANGNLTSKTDANGNVTSYAYNKLNLLVSKTDAPANTSSYSYDAVGNKLSETNPNGVVSSWAYDALQRVTSASTPAGSSYYRYDAMGNRISITNANGQTSSFVYNAMGLVITETTPSGATSATSYNPNGNKVSHTDFNGNTTSYVYDAKDRLIEETLPNGAKISYGYDANDNLTHVTNANGVRTDYVFDAADRKVKIVSDPGGISAATLIAYDAADNITLVTNANGVARSFVYDASNRLVLTTTDPGGINATTAYTYDGENNKLSETDPNNHTSTYRYNPMNHVKSVTNAVLETTSYSRDAAGVLTSMTLPNGNIFNLSYDGNGRLTGVTDNLGQVIQMTYDNVGNVTSRSNGSGKTTQYGYDADGNLTSIVDPLGEATYFTFDDNGNVLTIQDRKGSTESYVYDVMNRLIRFTDAQNSTTAYSYDGAGNLTAVTDDNGKTTSYTYDARNRLIRADYADASFELRSYDAVDNELSRTDNSGTTVGFEYDNLNRVRKRDFPGSANDDFYTYDDAGNLLTATNANASIAYTYDGAHRVLSESLNGKTTSYTYNTAQGKRTITYPGGRSIDEYMTVRRVLATIKEAGATLASYSYDLANNLSARAYANGVSTSYTYNDNSWLTAIDHSSTAQIAAFEYLYDKEGNKIYEKKLHRAAYSERFDYDNMHRLTGFKVGTLVGNDIPSPSSQSQFNYDGVGNRSTVVRNGATTTYTANAMNEYTQIVTGGSISPVYSSNGNLTYDGVNNFAFDSYDRLASVNAGSTATYLYDALDRRIAKIAGGTTINYYYDDERIIEERDASDAVIATYVHGNWIDDLVCMDRNSGERYYYHDNEIGSIVAISNTNATVVERYEYDAYGGLTMYDNAYTAISASAVGNRFTFTGREYDSESGLYYYRARHYDPAHGRARQRDPLHYIDGMNLYEYAQSRPTFHSDPMGTTVLAGGKVKKAVGQSRPQANWTVKFDFEISGPSGECNALCTLKVKMNIILTGQKEEQRKAKVEEWFPGALERWNDKFELVPTNWGRCKCPDGKAKCCECARICIVFDVTVDYSDKDNKKARKKRYKNYHQKVRLRGKAGRSRSNSWDVADDVNTVSHEFGHLIGARDEYANGSTDEGSIMNHQTDEAEARERHFWLIEKTANKKLKKCRCKYATSKKGG